MSADAQWQTMHFGRSWKGTRLEDECPCEKEPCGLVSQAKVDPSCLQHTLQATRTMRQMHFASACPGQDLTPNRTEGGDHLPTQIVSETSKQLSQSYERTQKQLASQPEMTVQVWDDALTELQGIDFQNPSVQQLVKAHSYVSILEQVLFSASAQRGPSNGN